MKSIALVEIKVKAKKDSDELRMKVMKRSPGILESDLEEIKRQLSSIIIPSPASMNIMHIYYHHLPSTASVIGRMIPVLSVKGSGDLRHAAYIQCLVVSPEALSDFGDNPVLLYQAMLSTDVFAAFSGQGEVLPPVRKWKKSPPLDADMVRGLLAAFGRNALLVVLQSVINSINTGFSGRTLNLYFLSGLYSFLPKAWRRELTFTMGIMFREDWVFRAIGISPDDKMMVKYYHKRKFPFFDLDKFTGKAYPLTGGWVRFIGQILHDGQYSSRFFRRSLNAPCGSQENCEDPMPPSIAIDSLGVKLLADYIQLRDGKPAGSKMPGSDSSDQDESEDALQIRTDMPRQDPEQPMIESDVPYPGHTPSMLPLELPLLQYESGNRIFSPYQRLIALFPEHKDLFLQLDSLIGHVLKYDQSAVEALRRFWKDLHTQLDDNTLWAIREDYIHYVHAALLRDNDDDTDPARKSLFTLEVLDILVN